MKSIETTIKKHRIQKGISQSDMAEKLHMTQSGYAKLENGQTKMDIDRLDQISKILEVDIAEFFEREDRMIQFNNNTIDNGYVENIYSDMKENYEKHIKHLEEEITYLREQLSR